MGVNLIGEEQRDRFTGFPISLSGDHAYIHSGKAFTVSGKTASVASGATSVLTFTTPATGKYVHMRPTSWSSSANNGEMRIAEGSTYSGGTDATAYNKNRNSTKTSTVGVKTAATMTVEGTIILYSTTASGGLEAARSGGKAGENEEIVLKPGTVYTIRFENIGATTATVFYYTLFWYEEDQGA